MRLASCLRPLRTGHRPVSARATRRTRAVFGHDPQVVCASRLANALWFLGEVDNARATRDQALAFARRSAHAFSTNVAYVFAALLSIDLGEHDDFETHAAQLREGRDWSWVFDVNATAMSGYSDALAGRTAKGIAEIRSAIGQLGHPNPYPGARSTLVRVLFAAYKGRWRRCRRTGGERRGTGSRGYLPVEQQETEVEARRTIPKPADAKKKFAPTISPKTV